MQYETITALGTTVGAVAITLLIVQYLKPAVGIKTRLFTWLLALVLLCTVTALTNPTIEAFVLAGVNSIVVATSAMGTYEMTFAKSDTKKKEV